MNTTQKSSPAPNHFGTGFQSHKVLATGTTGLHESFKQQNLGLVYVRTDDAEWQLGYLLRDDERRQIRIGSAVPRGRDRDAFGWSNKIVWCVFAIDRLRIREMRRID